MFNPRIPSAIALALSLAGCPTSNTQGDAAIPSDAFDPPLVPGIPAQAQRCELTRSELRRWCDRLVEIAVGPLSCLDGTDQPGFADSEACVSLNWDLCERGGELACSQPANAAIRCRETGVAICLMGTSPEREEMQRVNCSISAPSTCRIDRSLAYREP